VRYGRVLFLRREVQRLQGGSGAGIQQLLAMSPDFCCSDAPLTDVQLQQARQSGGDVMHIPLALGGIVPAYNLPGIDNPLRLSGPVLAGIYLGEIKKWNDPGLREINPGVDLPDQEIAVIHRADSSGSTFIFTDFLSKASKDWQDKIGTSASPKWAVGVGAKGNEGIVEAIAKRPGAIGYVELLHVLQSKIKFGSVKNKAGNYILASLESVVAAVEGAPADIPPDLRFSLTYTPGKEAYPICGCTWAILFVRQPDGQGQRLVDFLRWVAQAGQEYNTDLFYARLPPLLGSKVYETTPHPDVVQQALMAYQLLDAPALNTAAITGGVAGEGGVLHTERASVGDATANSSRAACLISAQNAVLDVKRSQVLPLPN